jgi:hypothetical protein
MIVSKENIRKLIKEGQTSLLIMWVGGLISSDNDPKDWDDNITNLSLLSEVLREDETKGLMDSKHISDYLKICFNGIEAIKHDKEEFAKHDA